MMKPKLRRRLGKQLRSHSVGEPVGEGSYQLFGCGVSILH